MTDGILEFIAANGPNIFSVLLVVFLALLEWRDTALGRIALFLCGGACLLIPHLVSIYAG